MSMAVHLAPLLTLCSSSIWAHLARVLIYANTQALLIFSHEPPTEYESPLNHKIFSVNKYWDINNICRAGQQAVQGSRSYTGASSPLADSLHPPRDLKGDCEIIVHNVKYRLPETSPLTMISLASKMCPTVCRLGVNYHLTLVVVLESEA